jgi:hypothetical protein
MTLPGLRTGVRNAWPSQTTDPAWFILHSRVQAAQRRPSLPPNGLHATSYIGRTLTQAQQYVQKTVVFQIWI